MEDKCFARLDPVARVLRLYKSTGGIPLRDMRVGRATSDGPTHFKLKTSGKEMLLRAEDAGEVESWIQQLDAVLAGRAVPLTPDQKRVEELTAEVAQWKEQAAQLQQQLNALKASGAAATPSGAHGHARTQSAPAIKSRI